jgi:NifU-like protein involved in Fe-S cluster formation
VDSAELLDHFENPRNAGELESPDASAQLENPVCGDILELSLRLDKRKLENKRPEKKELEGSRIADIRFRAKGCVPMIACGSAITELVKGKNLDEARQISREDLLKKVGGVPEASSHACQLAIDTLRSALRGL